MASRGGHAHFRYMSYIEKLKEFFYSETIGWISTIFGSNTYWVTPHEYCSNQVDICKNMAARVGGAYFPYMSYIEKLKKIKQLLSETTCLILSKFGQKQQCPEGTNKC